MLAASSLKLLVMKPGGEQDDLDDLEALYKNGVFNFTTLCVRSTGSTEVTLYPLSCTRK